MRSFSLSIPLIHIYLSVHRIIGRGGFGEVYGCRKADTGKMYAMKCLDKKRIKMKQGETLALNERIMLSLVSTGQVCLKRRVGIDANFSCHAIDTCCCMKTTKLYSVMSVSLRHMIIATDQLLIAFTGISFHCLHDIRLSHSR